MRQEFLAKSKVGQYDVALRVEKNIFQLDIAVDDAELSYMSKANKKRQHEKENKREKETFKNDNSVERHRGGNF